MTSKPMTIKQVARETGGVVSEEYIRAACHRAPDQNPLPHIECGKKRPIIRTDWDTFCAWYQRECMRVVGL